MQEEHLPENTNIEEEISSMIASLGFRYGYDCLKEYLYDYTNKLEQISELNRLLLLMDAEQNAEGYSKVVGDVMDATQAYYSYLGTLPEDLRRFFFRLSESPLAGGNPIDELHTLLDLPVPAEMSLLPSIQSIRPKTYIMQVDAITNQLTNLTGRDRFKVGSKGKQPIQTTVTLDIPEHMKIEGGAALSTYDKSIINGVTSLLESGNPIFSIPMLYHAMTGKQNPTIDEVLYEELSTKLEKMRRLMLTIDLTEESRAKYLPHGKGTELDIENLTIEGYLLPLNKMSGVINGKKTELYQLITNPPLYTYSKLKRQLASVPLFLLNAPVNNNSTTIPLKTYLLQRIEMMKNSRNAIRSTIILYESIYSELEATDASKTKKQRIREYTGKILTYFVENRYIGGYMEFKKGRSVAGIKINLPETNR